MTNKQKLDLQWQVRYYLGDGKPKKEIVKLLHSLGFAKPTIRKYITAFSK